MTALAALLIVGQLMVRSRMRSSTPLLTLISGVVGTLIAVLFGLLQWRLIWLENHPSRYGGFLVDWSPYPEWLTIALNWWGPVSLVILGSALYVAARFRGSPSLIVGCCLHTGSVVGLVSLGAWLFGTALPGEYCGVWWMWWI